MKWTGGVNAPAPQQDTWDRVLQRRDASDDRVEHVQLDLFGGAELGDDAIGVVAGDDQLTSVDGVPVVLGLVAGDEQARPKQLGHRGQGGLVVSATPDQLVDTVPSMEVVVVVFAVQDIGGEELLATG